jgi:phosphoserine aminotransferase
MNLLGPRKGADYLYTGIWSAKALAEARRFCEVSVAVTGEADNFLSIPYTETWKLDSDAAYVYYTANETIGGLEFHTIPDVGQVPLVSDMTSSFLSQPLDVSRFGLIFAGAQKNVAPAGLTVVVIRDDLVGSARDDMPTLYNYATHVKSKCMYNTPPSYNWYIAGLVFQWIKKQGGLTGMAKINKIKSEKLYAAIDTSDYYHNPVSENCRSRMNIPFTLVDESHESDFLKEAKTAGLIALGGHRSVGGCEPVYTMLCQRQVLMH